MEKLEILQQGETLAYFMNAALIGSLAEASWNNQAKRLDGKSNPDPDGPIHLTTFSWSFKSSDQVVTKIGGYDERPWPDVDFTISIVDTLSATGSMVRCDSVSSLDADTSWLNMLTAISLIVLPPLGLFFLYEDIKAGDAHAPKIGGVGFGAAQSVPYEFLIPAGRKIVASYSRVNVSGGGLFAGGRWNLDERVPQVSIQGTFLILVEEGTASVSRYFAATTEDLRSPQFRWTATDDHVVNPRDQGTEISFDLTGSRAGDKVQKAVTVDTFDEDGLTAHADGIVTFHLLPRPPL